MKKTSNWSVKSKPRLLPQNQDIEIDLQKIIKDLIYE